MTPRPTGAVVDLDRLLGLATQAGPRAAPGLARGRTGGRSGPRRGQGGDPYDLRPFQEGDDPRRIDPAATARTGRPQIRSRHEEVESTLLLIADFRTPMLWGTQGRFRSVAAAEALALEGWGAVLAGGRVGSLIVRDGESEMLAPRSREAAMLGICAALARAHRAACDGPVGDHEALYVILDGVSPRIRPGTSVQLATGFDDPGAGFGAAAAALMRKCRLEVLLIQDAFEASPPAGTFVARLGQRIARGRLGAPSSAAALKAHGVPTRIVDARAPLGEETAA